MANIQSPPVVPVITGTCLRLPFRHITHSDWHRFHFSHWLKLFAWWPIQKDFSLLESLNLALLLED